MTRSLVGPSRESAARAFPFTSTLRCIFSAMRRNCASSRSEMLPALAHAWIVSIVSRTALRSFLPLRREVQKVDAPVVRIGDAFDDALGLHRIDRARDRGPIHVPDPLAQFNLRDAVFFK